MDIARLFPHILATDTGATLPIAISLFVTAVLFILARVAFDLYKSGDLVVSAKRIVDLNPRVLRLNLQMENHQGHECVLSDLRVAKKQGKEWVVIGTIAAAPIQSRGDSDFVKSENGGYSFVAAPGSINVVVVEFALTEPAESVFLLGTNKKGKSVKAKMTLTGQAIQQISFR